MSEDKELAIKLQFLEEAQEYLNTIESVLLSFSTNPISEQMDSALRAAHSIKGGAAMMGFDILSHLAHRIEDFFKVLKVQKDALNDELERLLLLSVDYLRQVIDCYLLSKVIQEEWLEKKVNPVLDYLYKQLGDPPVENLIAETPETGQEMVALIFETEVEGCLQRLESVIANPVQPCLLEEVSILAQQFAGLGEMLQLNAFTSLCNSISQHLETNPEQFAEIANHALQAWRHCQALVQTGQVELFPTQIYLPSSFSTGMNIANATAIEQIASISDLEGLEQLLITNNESILDLQSFFNQPEFQDYEFLSPQENLSEPRGNFQEKLATNNEELDNTFITNFSSDTDTSAKFDPELQASIPPNIAADDSNLGKSTPTLETARKVAPSAYNFEKQELTVRVPFKQLTQLNDLFGELTIERNGLELRLEKLRNLFNTLKRKIQILEQSNVQLRSVYDKISTEAVTASRKHSLMAADLRRQNIYLNENSSNINDASLSSITNISSNSKFDILEMDQYNDLHLLSQEVMETIVQIQEVKTDIELNLEDTEQTVRELNRTAKHMQTGFNQLRMRPLADVVGRFPRALRDLCLEYSKNVELKIYGSETLIERTILEAISDPLMHLLRNAFDHGIEAPSVRLAAGKPEQGKIEIRAQLRGNRTVITISDDGNGIPIDKIQRKALQIGLDAADLAAVSSQQLLELIFEPGFSTAEHITTLSGRGVGLDVVRTNIKQINGDIQVDSKPGVGTTFTISVPLTLSVMRVLIIESNGMLLALPKDAIKEMILLKPELILITEDKEVLNWQACQVPLANLSQSLKFYCPHKPIETEATPTINEPTVLLVSQGNDLVGVKIDRCWGEQEVAIRQVEGAIALPKVFSGCTILGDGRIVPLVDILSLLDLINSNSFTQDVKQNQRPHLDNKAINSLAPTVTTQSDRNTVLVIDDSINVRRYLALTLEKAGYQVEQAKDGQDALDKLFAGLVVQAVICDIEMPRLDGYGFLGRIKSNDNLNNLPVAMLTSRSGDKHRQLAMNLGASAYLSKPYKEADLLATINQLIN